MHPTNGGCSCDRGSRDKIDQSEKCTEQRRPLKWRLEKGEGGGRMLQ